MIKLTFDKYYEILERFEKMPNISCIRGMSEKDVKKALENPELLNDENTNVYGITEADMQRMEANPEKYLKYAMYLSTRPYYKDGGDDSFVFINADAMKPINVAFRLDELIDETIELYDAE